MQPKIIGLIVILGCLLALGIDTSYLALLAILILLLACSFSLLWRGKWLPQFGGSLIGLWVGPCLVAILIRILLARLHFPHLAPFSFSWAGLLSLGFGLLLAALISYLVVKRRLRFLQQGPLPVTNERQPIYAPRRRALPEE